jgi:hypothetical protein
MAQSAKLAMAVDRCSINGAGRSNDFDMDLNQDSTACR